jgi:acetyl-CoA carboxylase biotin carboxyl carrier protein
MATKTEKNSDKTSLEILELKDLYEMMVVEGLDILEVKDEDGRIYLNRQAQSAPVTYARPSPATRTVSRGVTEAVKSEPAAKLGETIKAPLAGVFYRSGSPARPPFAKEGDVVDAGQTLCIIEAMKVMNEIKAEKRCRIVKIAAENSRPVTVEQDLFWIESA